MKRFALAQRMALAVSALSIAACGGGNLTLPEGGVTLVVDGNGQHGTVGEELPERLVVTLKNDEGAPLAGRPVVFTSDNPADDFVPDTAHTDDEGQAFTRWVLGTAPGSYTGEARAVAEGDGAAVLTAVTLHAEAAPGEPDTVRAEGKATRGGSRGEALEDPLTVVVVDRFGNPVGGTNVQWKVADGNSGSLSSSDTQTGEDGRASVTWTLGSRLGIQQVEARVDKASGSPVTFTAVALF